DDLAAELEVERLRSLPRRVELLAARVLHPDVVDRQRLPVLGGRAGPLDDRRNDELGHGSGAGLDDRLGLEGRVSSRWYWRERDRRRLCPDGRSRRPV